MPALADRAAARLVAMCMAMHLVSGCTDQPATPTSPPSPSLNPSSPAAAIEAVPTANPPGPLTGTELVWLEAIATTREHLAKVLASSSSVLTPATLRSMAEQLRGCARDLARLGVPTMRLQLVYDLVKQGCAKYDQAAVCFEAAASIGIPRAGSADERKFHESIDCGFALPGDAGKLLVDAQIQSEKIRDGAV
jgi:hypothetical protein